MASEYTTHRRYPLSTDQDKPNLRDQYNGAIRMIDGDMDDALDASGHVTDALGAGFDAQHTVRMALDDANAKFGSGVTASNTVTAQLNGKASQTESRHITVQQAWKRGHRTEHRDCTTCKKGKHDRVASGGRQNRDSRKKLFVYPVLG